MVLWYSDHHACSKCHSDELVYDEMSANTENFKLKKLSRKMICFFTSLYFAL